MNDLNKDLNKYHISTVKDIVYNAIFDKRKLISKKTFNTLRTQYSKIIKENKTYKKSLIRFFKNKVETIQPLSMKYEKSNEGFKQVPDKAVITNAKINQIKKNEKQALEIGKKKLKNFLNDNKLSVALYLTIYIEEPAGYKGTNTITYDNKQWVPRSQENSKFGNLNSFFLDYEGIDSKNLYNILKKYTYQHENQYDGSSSNYDKYLMGHNHISAVSLRNFIEKFDGFSEFQSLWDNLHSNEKLIRVSDVQLKKSKDLPLNYFSDDAFDDGFNLHLSNPYIKSKTNKDFYENDYVINNYKSRSCWLSLLIEIYKEPIEKYYKKTKITYEFIHSIIAPGKILKESNNGYSFDEVKLFFEKFGLGVYMFDISFNIQAQFLPEKRNKNINPYLVYVVYHNKHIYHINNDTNSLCRKLDHYYNKIVIREPSDKYYLSKYKPLDNKTKLLKDYDELVTIINSDLCGDINLFYEDSCLDLWVDLLTKMKYEASIKMKNGSLNFDSITLKNINEKNINIITHKEEHVNLSEKFNCNEMFHNYLEKQNRVKTKLLNKNYISTYSDQLNEMLKLYSGCPLVRMFENLYESVDCIEIDFNKYYASILRDIEYMPIVNVFDRFENYKNEEIRDYTLYFVEKKNDEHEYPINRFSLCYGMNIKEITDKLNIISYLQPSKLKKNISKSLMEEVYNDESLTETMRKNIFNHSIGMFNKSFNQSTYSCISNNINEAKKIKELCTGRIIPVCLNYDCTISDTVTDYIKYANEKQNYFINYISNKKEIKNGFKLISLLIYDIAHKRLLDLKRKVENYGLTVYKASTDALLISKNNFSKFKEENSELFGWDKALFSNIGLLKVKNKECNQGFTKEIQRTENFYQCHDTDYNNEIILKDEWDKDELSSVIHCSNKLIIKAHIAGGGKTSSFKNYMQKYNKKGLFVCPYNSLCFSLKSEGFNSVTLDKLVGCRFSEDDFKTTKKYNIDDYDLIIFDEIYLYNTERLMWIKNFIDENPSKKIYSTGDEYQLDPIETDLNNVNDRKNYYNRIIQNMFFNSVLLHDNKRCKTKEDQEKIKKITKSIRDCKYKSDAVKILKDNFKVIYNKEEIVTKKNVVGLNRTADWINSLIHQPIEGEVYYQGLNLICRKSIITKDYNLKVNYTYEILECSSNSFTLTDGDEEYIVDKKTVQKYMRLSYSRTCNSYQGLSEDEPITIFDINHFMVTVNWIYTAITRTTDLNNISIYLGKTVYEENEDSLKKQIENMIDGHKHSDVKNNRIMDEKYIDVKWTMNELKNTRKCSECNKYLDVSNLECFSIDRIDNNLGHYQFNCRIICRHCNICKK
jgi:hypothetical protein